MNPWNLGVKPNPFFNVVEAPERRPDISDGGSLKVFLAGSIDMGNATDWQARVIDALSDLPITVFNPRRRDFDPSWPQEITCEPFVEQVGWELDHLAMADIVCFYFDPKGQAPVTLLEMGLHIRGGRSVVYCPPGFWRRGNVQITAKRFGAAVVDTEEAFIAELRSLIWDYGHNGARFRK